MYLNVSSDIDHTDGNKTSNRQKVMGRENQIPSPSLIYIRQTAGPIQVYGCNRAKCYCLFQVHAWMESIARLSKKGFAARATSLASKYETIFILFSFQVALDFLKKTGKT